MAIDRSLLGVAGEFAVAAELCRRSIYAQLTFGYQKRMDLLMVSETGTLSRVEVKAKQGREWPNCQGISAQDSLIVFVDFAGKEDTERPDFYVLTAREWHAVATAARDRYLAKHPERRAEVTEGGVLVLLDEVNAAGIPYRGVGVRPEHIPGHREAWDKFTDLAGGQMP